MRIKGRNVVKTLVSGCGNPLASINHRSPPMKHLRRIYDSGREAPRLPAGLADEIRTMYGIAMKRIGAIGCR